VKESWGEEATEGLDYTYEVIQNWNNVLLHSSPLGYRMAMDPTSRQINRAGPDERWREALAYGCLAFYLVLRVIAQEWGLDRSTAGRLFVHASCVTKRLTDDKLRAVNDGEPPRDSWRRFLLSGLSRSRLLVLDWREPVAAAV
jgi:hypothetical protein